MKTYKGWKTYKTTKVEGESHFTTL